MRYSYTYKSGPTKKQKIIFNCILGAIAIALFVIDVLLLS